MEKNYDGLKVLDFTRVLVGPYLTMMLSDMGANVIKIERPGVGADERSLEPIIQGVNGKQSGYYMMLNRGKKSVVLDLKAPETREIIFELVKWADVVVENFAPGVIKKLGYDYQTLRQIKPNIIMLSVSTFGQEGPLSKRPGYDIIAQAMSGLMSMTGDPDRSPQRSGTSIGDVNAAAHALGALGAALYYKSKTGKGQYIDIAMRDCLSSVLETAIIRSTMSNGKDSPKRSGSHHATMAPYGIFEAGHDRYVVLAVLNQGQWNDLAKVIGRPDAIEDPRFESSGSRARNLPVVKEMIEGWLQSFEDINEALNLLEANSVPAAPVLTIEQLLEDPQFLRRNNLVEVKDPIFGDVKLPVTPMIFSETTTSNPVPPPLLGEHTEEVLRDIVRLSEEKISMIKEKNGL